MRPVLNPGVYYAGTTTGAYLLTHHGRVRLTGERIVDWLDRLTPHLDGRQSLAELTAGLPPAHREMVTRIITTLHQHRVVRDAAADRRSLDGPESGEHAPDLDYLRCFRDDPAAALHRYREGTVLVLGTGPLVPALVDAALCSGVTHLRVAAWAGTAQQPAARGPQQQVDWYPLPTSVDGLTELLDGVALTLHTTGDSALAEQVERCCAAAGVLLGQAVVDGDEVWLLPPAPASAPATPDARQSRSATGWSATGWSAAQPRLHAFPGAGATDAAAPAAATSAVGSVAAPVHGGQVPREVAMVAAARLVQSAFRIVTGVEPATVGPAQIINVQVSRLGSTVHTFVPHPLTQPAAPLTEAAFCRQVAELAAGPRLSPQEFSRRAAQLADSRLGVFRFTERASARVPLHVSEAEVASPAGSPGSPAPTGRNPRTVVAAALDYQEARCRAALGALADYAWRCCDQRRLLPGGTVWGWELAAPGLDGAARRVPASVAFGGYRRRSFASGRIAGLGAGYDWAEAVTVAVVDHCRRRTIARVRRAATPYPRLDLAAAKLDELGERCREVLAALGELPEVYEVTGALQVPTFAFCLGPTTITYSAGLSNTAALATGLQQVMLAVQAGVFQESWYAPPAAAELPPRLRGAMSGRGTPAVTGDSLPDVVARLRRAGYVPVAVPLDHDPGVSGVMPYLVRVVLRDG